MEKNCTGEEGETIVFAQYSRKCLGEKVIQNITLVQCDYDIIAPK